MFSSFPSPPHKHIHFTPFPKQVFVTSTNNKKEKNKCILSLNKEKEKREQSKSTTETHASTKRNGVKKIEKGKEIEKTGKWDWHCHRRTDTGIIPFCFAGQKARLETPHCESLYFKNPTIPLPTIPFLNTPLSPVVAARGALQRKTKPCPTIPRLRSCRSSRRCRARRRPSGDGCTPS